MASLPRTSRISKSSSTLTSHSEHKVAEPTGNEAFTPDEAQPLPSLKDEHGHPSISPKDHITREPVSSKDATSESIISLVGGFVAGVALAISYHLFLTFMNGRDINEYPQYWVKNVNNAFSVLFSICIAFVATCALIQMKWNVARSKPLSIRSIDNLFALPSPLALFTTVTSTRLRSLRIFLIPILAAVFIQSVALVSVFAPNALTVAPSAEISRDIRVPTLDLSTGPITSIPMYPPYIPVSQLWTTVLTSIMLQPPTLNWKIPPGCGTTCKFDLLYDGPGLQCADTPLEPPPFTGPVVYNATSPLYLNPGTCSPSVGTLSQYELRISYHSLNETAIILGLDQGSVYCVFRNTKYKASFQVENNTMQVNHSIQSYGDILGNDESDVLCDADGVNTRAMCYVFASAFTGKIQVASPSDDEQITGGINQAVVDLFFSHDPQYIAYDFHLVVSNLSESLVSLFSNLTLGFIPYRNDTTTVWADLWDGSYTWSYTAWILWVVYLPTLLLASVVMLSGLLSIRSNKRGMDDKLSNLLLTAMNTELDVLCMDAEDFSEFQRFRLLYQREKGTFSVASGGEYPK